MAYTRYWPLHTRHLPGEENDISHILSHLGDQARRRQQYLDAMGAAALACPVSVHSYHSPSDDPDPLSGFEVFHLPFSAADVAEVQRAYLTDSSLVHAVPLCDIYKVVTGHPDAE